jgi:hypothetical protein
MTNDKLRRADAEFLLTLPEFRRFLFRSIQLAGILDHTTRATTGSDGRDLAFAEGRRSQGFDILAEAALGQPEQVRGRDPLNLMTLISALTEEAQTPPEEKKRGRDDRYGNDDRDADDGSPGG